MTTTLRGCLLLSCIVALLEPLQAQWTQTGGPCGGDVESLVYAGGALYACAGGGLFCSTDNGANWSLKSYTSPGNISVLVADGTRLFAGTTHGQVFLSTDNCASWVSRATGLPDGRLTELIAQGDSLMTVMNSSNIYRSTDGGAHWAESDSNIRLMNGAWTTNCLACRGADVFVGTWFGVYHTLDWGQTWTRTNQGLADTTVLALAFIDTMLYAGTFRGVSYSTDGGRSWSTAGDPQPLNFEINSLASLGDSIFAGSTSSRVFLSVDNGRSWSLMNAGMTRQRVVQLLSSGAGLYAVTDHGMFRFAPTKGEWTQVNAGLTNSTIYTLFGSQQGMYAGVEATGVFLSTDHGISWEPRNKGITEKTVYGDIYALGEQGRYLFAGAYNDGFRSSDAGETWTPLNLSTGNVWAFAVKDSAIFASWSGVSRSMDSGATWTQTMNGLTDGVIALVARGGTLLAGSYWAGVRRSTDDGANWYPTDGSYRLPIASLLVVDSTFYAGTDGEGVYRSTDDGLNWSPTEGIPGNGYIWALAAAGKTLFAGTQHGAFASSDGGATWDDVSSPGMDVPVYTLTVSGSDLYAGTVGRAVWRRPLSEMVTSTSGARGGTPSIYWLGQNFPNPFNPTTTIRYALPHRSHVLLAVYNTLGQKVAELLNGDSDAGYHEVQFDGKNLASGVYYYRLQAGSFVETKKLLMLR